MSNWEAGADRYLADLGGRTAARGPATLGEIWQAEWDAAALDTTFGLAAVRGKAFEDARAAAEQAAGMNLVDYARREGVDFVPSNRSRMGDLFGRIVAQAPEDKREALAKVLDYEARAIEEAHRRERIQQETSERAYGLSGVSTGFLAGVARQMVDPINLATMPLGGPGKGGLIRFLGREAGYNAAAQAVQEPLIQSQRAALDLESGFGEALTNIGEAAIGGAALAGTFRAAGYVLRRGLDAVRSPRVDAPEQPAPAPDAAPVDAQPAPARPADPVAVAPARADAPDIVTAGDPVVVARADAPSAPVDAPPARADAPSAPVDAPPARAVARSALVDAPNGAYDAVRARLEAMRDRLSAEDFDAAAHVVERDQAIARSAASIAPGHAEQSRLIDGIDRAAQALESGRLQDLPAHQPDPQTIVKRPRRVPKRPLTLAEHIAYSGGIELDAEARAADLHKWFIPGAGPLARKSGKSVDGHWRVALMEDGYLDADADGTISRDIRNELFERLRRERISGQSTYSRFEQDEAYLIEQRRAREMDRVNPETIARHEEVDRAVEAMRADPDSPFAGQPDHFFDDLGREMRDGNLSVDEAADRVWSRYEQLELDAINPDLAELHARDLDEFIGRREGDTPPARKDDIPFGDDDGPWQAFDDIDARIDAQVAARLADRASGAERGDGGPAGRPSGGGEPVQRAGEGVQDNRDVAGSAGTGRADDAGRSAGIDEAFSERAQIDAALDRLEADNGPINVTLTDEATGAVRILSARELLTEADDAREAAQAFAACVASFKGGA